VLRGLAGVPTHDRRHPRIPHPAPGRNPSCSVAVRSASGVSPPAVCASVRASGRYRRNAASSRSATTRRDRPARVTYNASPRRSAATESAGWGSTRADVSVICSSSPGQANGT
jgi:hypothetical protein